jgi:hypothetical protein
MNDHEVKRMRFFGRIVLMVVGVYLSSACTTQREKENVEAIDTLIQHRMSRGGIIGLAAGIVSDDTLGLSE